MAKFGEGDDRWIVNDLGQSGTNVNNWHWTERDCTEWAKQRISSALTGLQLVDEPGMSARITEMDAFKGEALLNVRKNKLIPAYELDVRVKWTGEVKEGDGTTATSCTGKIHFPYISDENHDEDPELKVVCDAGNAASERLKAAILARAKAAMVDIVHKFVAELRAGGPTLSETPAQQQAAAAAGAAAKAGGDAAGAAPSSASTADAAKQKAIAAAAAASGSGRTSVSLTQRFHCRPQDIYDCFTHQGRVCAFTQSQAQVAPQPGGAFSWYGGSIQGTFEELQPPHKIVMRWRFNTWQEGEASTVVLTIAEPEHGNTVVTLKQTGIPQADKFGNEDVVNVTEAGWQSQVFQRIRSVFGYGV